MRDFYDGFHRFYGLIEGNIGPTLGQALTVLDPTGGRYRTDSVLEWASGSGELAFRLVPRIGAYEGRDQSEGMRGRAGRRWEAWHHSAKARYPQAPFFPGDMVEGPSGGESWDWIFMSFALHLFDPATETKILAQSLDHVRKGVVVIEHEQRWRPVVALAEWAEGSHWDQFLKIDFDRVAADLGVVLTKPAVPGALVMEFLKGGEKTHG
jgi:ubiquinone/menaquinone biosynthesis C-methylase UbiE